MNHENLLNDLARTLREKSVINMTETRIALTIANWMLENEVRLANAKVQQGDSDSQ